MVRPGILGNTDLTGVPSSISLKNITFAGLQQGAAVAVRVRIAAAIGAARAWRRTSMRYALEGPFVSPS